MMGASVASPFACSGILSKPKILLRLMKFSMGCIHNCMAASLDIQDKLFGQALAIIRQNDKISPSKL